MLVEIFCEIDDFCKFLKKSDIKMIGENNQGIGRRSLLTASEIMSIAIYYHESRFTDFKTYYKTMIKGYLSTAFPYAPSYNRFIELRQKMLIPLILFTKIRALGQCNGLSIIDSTPLEVCHIKRAYSHKLFKGIAQKGKTSTGWFYGFKLHIIISAAGEILNFFITPGNIADNNPEVLDNLTHDIFGKLAADKGYIGAFPQMYEKGIHLIHGIRKNMKNKLMHVFDKLFLKKRGVIESVFSILKQWLSLEPARSRSKIAYFVEILCAIIAYAFRPLKPTIFFEFNLEASLSN